SFRYDYEILPTGDALRRFETRVAGYWYEIAGADGRELIAFHWHPVGASPITFPHLHLSSRIGSIAIDGDNKVALGEMHIPTGPVEMGDVARLLIAEFGAQPRRLDWAAVLRRT